MCVVCCVCVCVCVCVVCVCVCVCECECECEYEFVCACVPMPTRVHTAIFVVGSHLQQAVPSLMVCERVCRCVSLLVFFLATGVSALECLPTTSPSGTLHAYEL